MADSFMIHFSCNGKHCYANVYAYDTIPKEYHVHVVNTVLLPAMPQSLVLIEKNEKLCLREGGGIDEATLRQIIIEIQKHNGRDS